MMTGSIEDILRFYPVFEVDACRLKQRGRGSFLTVKRGSASAVSCNVVQLPEGGDFETKNCQ